MPRWLQVKNNLFFIYFILRIFFLKGWSYWPVSTHRQLFNIQTVSIYFLHTYSFPTYVKSCINVERKPKFLTCTRHLVSRLVYRSQNRLNKCWCHCVLIVFFFNDFIIDLKRKLVRITLNFLVQVSITYTIHV